MRLKFTTPLKDQTVTEGDTARFELEVSHDNVPITWYKNETKLHPGRNVLTHVDGKKHILELKEVTLDDISQIKAEAKGISTTANLMVLGNHSIVLYVRSNSVTHCIIFPSNLCVYVRLCAVLDLI